MSPDSATGTADSIRDRSMSIRDVSVLRGVSEAAPATSGSSEGLSRPGRGTTTDEDSDRVAGRWQSIDGQWRIVPVESPAAYAAPAPMEVDEVAEEPAPAAGQTVDRSSSDAGIDDEEAPTAPLEKAAKAEALDAVDALADVTVDENADAEAEADADGRITSQA